MAKANLHANLEVDDKKRLTDFADDAGVSMTALVTKVARLLDEGVTTIDVDDLVKGARALDAIKRRRNNMNLKKTEVAEGSE